MFAMCLLCEVLLPVTTVWKSMSTGMFHVLSSVILNKTALGFSRYNLPPVDPYRTFKLISLTTSGTLSQ